MSHLVLTNFEWQSTNSTARWKISLGRFSDACSRFFAYGGHKWEVEIERLSFPGNAVAVKCVVWPLSGDVTYDVVNEFIRLSIVQNSLNEKLWSFEKNVQFEFSPVPEYNQYYQRILQVVKEILDGRVANVLMQGDSFGERDFSLVLEFGPFENGGENNAGGVQLPLKPTEESQTNDWKDLSENILSLLLKKKDFDVTLNVSGRSFRAHRLILSAQSPVFDRMFEHNLIEKKTGTVDIPDCDPNAFEVYLFYLYSGNLYRITENNVSNLYYIADKYGSEKLAWRCLCFMKNNLSIRKFGEFVSVILNHPGAKTLLEAAICFLADNSERIVETAAWKQFINDNPHQGCELIIKAHKNFALRSKQ